MGYFFAALAGYALGILTVAIIAIAKVATEADKRESADEDDYIIGCEPYDGGDDCG